MLRFARAAGSAEEWLVLAYPTTDLNGEPLLPAGFLDDLIRRLDAGPARPASSGTPGSTRSSTAMPDLARSPVDARVLAVARACLGRRFDRPPATSPDRPVTPRRSGDGRRLRGGPVDGGTTATSAPTTAGSATRRPIARIAAEFGPTTPSARASSSRSPSARSSSTSAYVLGLKLVDERHELDEDYAGRGNQVHDVLEKIHQQIVAEGATDVIGRLAVLIETDMRVELERLRRPARPTSPRSSARSATRRTDKALARYLGQFRDYVGRDGETPDPHRFEVLFGQPRRGSSHPHLTIGRGRRRGPPPGQDRPDRPGPARTARPTSA